MYFLLKLSMRAVTKLLTFPALAGLRNSTALDADLVSTDLRICWRGHHSFFFLSFLGRGVDGLLTKQYHVQKKNTMYFSFSTFSVFICLVTSFRVQYNATLAGNPKLLTLTHPQLMLFSFKQLFILRLFPCIPQLSSKYNLGILILNYLRKKLFYKIKW